MTTVEIERVSAPDIERRDAREERERRASVLEAAALEIEVRGWTQGALCNGNWETPMEVCATGGILCALGGLRTPWDRASKTLGVSADALADWNDRTERTVDEVTFLLRWRAQELRDGWDTTRRVAALNPSPLNLEEAK